MTKILCVPPSQNNRIITTTTADDDLNPSFFFPKINTLPKKKK